MSQKVQNDTCNVYSDISVYIRNGGGGFHAVMWNYSYIVASNNSSYLHSNTSLLNG